MGVSIWEGSKAQGIIDAINAGFSRLNLLVSELVNEESHATPVATLNEIHEIVRAGEAANVFSYGDQINLNYNDGTNDYVLPWDIVAFGDYELQDGETKPGMVIQSHYAMEGLQFDASEAIYLATSNLPAGTYHFTIGETWGTYCIAGKVYQFTTSVAIPSGGQVVVAKNNDFYTWAAPDTAPSNWKVHIFADSSSTTPLATNLAVTEGAGGTDLGTLLSTTKYSQNGINNLQRAAYGYNRWSQSAMRQRLNSDAAAGAWWSPQNPFDRAPQQLSTLRGFMAGFDEAFLNIIKPTKVRTALNTVSDSEIGTYEDTYDTFFLASLEQEYIRPQASGVEGAYWPYWKERLGLESPQGTGSANANARHIRYAFNAKTSAQHCRLRAAIRSNANATWYVTSAGYAGNSSATNALRGCPACVII